MKKVSNLIKKTLSIIIIWYLLISCELTKKDQSANLLNDSVKNKELSFCNILKSLSDKISSTPYDTYRGTPYLVTKKESNKFSTLFKYYEEYPEYDEFGTLNGGKITLSRLIIFDKSIVKNKITIMSINDTIVIDGTSKFINKYDKFFIFNLNDYFEGDPFYMDKIDFKVQINTNYNGRKPVLIGVYWDNLDDYYENIKCK